LVAYALPSITNTHDRSRLIVKLFYSPGASSLSSHIVLREAGLTAELIRVDLETKNLHGTRQSYLPFNPMGKVPALELDNGEMLTEGLAVLQYLADLAPASHLAPPEGTMARYRMAEALSFVATELHKGFAPMFDADVPANYKHSLIADTRAFERTALLVQQGPFIFGEYFTIADAYLYPILRLGRLAGLDFSRWPAVVRYMDEVAKRPAVHAAMQAEGLLGD